jgi:pimeloyl-ACP methyl ester carboxylesterase
MRVFDSHPGGPCDNVLFLLHGLGNSLDFWIELAPLLSQSVRTLAVDIPGFGQSPPPPGGVTLTNVASVIESFLIERQISGAALVGHSMGGFVALELAGRKALDPRFVALLGGTLHAAAAVLSSPAAAAASPAITLNLVTQFVGGVIPLGTWGAALLGRSTLLRRLLLWPFVAHPERLDESSVAFALRNNGGWAVITAARVGRHVDVDTLLRGVRGPLRLLWGDRDRLVSTNDLRAAQLVAQLDDVRVLEGCGHWPMLEEADQLARFLLSGFEPNG